MARLSYLGTRHKGVETLTFTHGSRRWVYRIEPIGVSFMALQGMVALSCGSRRECFESIRADVSVAVGRISLHR